MSTGGGQTKPIELLAALGINDDISKKNIQTYIKRLKNLPAIKMSLDVKGTNTQILIEFEKQLQALEQQLQSVNQKYQEIGSGSTPSLSFFDELKKQITHSVKSINTLSQAFGDANINVSKFYKQLAKTPAGDLRTLENIVSKLKTEVETISFNHIQFGSIQETLANLQALESNLYTIYELNKAYADTADFEQLTSQITDLNTQLSNIQLGEGLNIAGLSDIPQQLEKINQGIEAFGKNTAAAAQSSTSLTSSIMTGISHASTLKTVAEDVTGIVAFSKKALLGFNIAGIVLGASEFALNEYFKYKEKEKEKLEELKAEDQEILKSYSSNANEINSQVDRYTQLEKSMALGNADPTVLAEYQDISNRLGELLPHIVAHEDEYGNKIIGSSEALKVKIDLLKEQQALETQIAGEATKEKRNEDIKTRKGAISDLEDEYDSKLNDAAKDLRKKAKNLPTKEMFYGYNHKPMLDSPEDFDDKIKKFNKLQSAAEKSGNKKLADDYKELSDALKYHKEEIIKTESELNQNVLAQKNDYISNIADVINENDKLTDSVKNNAEGFAAQLIAAANTSDLDTLQDSLTSLFSNEDASTLINDVIGSFQKMENATSETFNAMASQTHDKIENMSDDLLKLGLSEEEVNSIMGSLEKRFTDTTRTQRELSNEMKVNNLTFAEAKEKVFGYNEEVEKLTTIYEQQAGVSQKKVNDTSDLLFQYEALTNQLNGYTEEEIRNLSQKGNLSAEEQSLIDKLNSKDLIMSSLNKLYPSLLDQDGKAIALSEEKIEAIQAENHANETLLKAYQLARDGKLSVEQQMTVDAAKAAKDRIEIKKSEIQSLMFVNLNLQKFIDNQNKGSNMTEREALGAMRASMIQAANNDKIDEKTNELNSFQKILDSNISSIDKFISAKGSSQKAFNAANKTAKESNKTTKDSIYITDKFKQTLENLNLEIEKQVKVQANLPKHSAEYRKSLQTQLELERDKLSLLENQEKSLKSQISSGKINKTGTVAGNTSTTTSSTKLNGWSGKITSNFGNRILNGKKDFHLGVDIDGTKGQRLDAPVSGTVIKSGYAGNNKEDSSYGNIVMIKDDSGIKHLFAHMEKTLVKIGDNVTAGTQIGTIGNSGTVSSTSGDGSHLHYEVRKNDKAINPIDYLNNAKSGTVSSTNYTAVETTLQAIDQAKSELVRMQSDVLNQKEVIAKIEKDIIDSQLSYFDWKRGNIQSNLDYEDAKLKLVDKSSSRYTKTIDLQTKYLEQKQAVNNEELKYIEDLIKNGSLSAVTLDEMKGKLLELKTEMLDTNNAISQMALNKLDIFEYQRSLPESQLDYENVKIKELDTNSARYAKTLQLMTIYMNQKQNVNRNELNYLQQQIANGKHFGEMLEKLKERYVELTTEMKALDIEIREKNYEIILNIKTQYDEKNDEIQYQIDRSKLIQSMYKEGSADATREINFQIEKTNELYNNTVKEIEELQDKLHFDLNPEDIKKIGKDLDELSLLEIQIRANLKDYDKQLEDSEQKVVDELANKLFNAYKEYIQEKRDAHIKSIDEEIKRENERHDKVMDNYKDEMDLFRKNVQDKLQLIDRQEAQRDYNQDINKLEKDRNDIQGQYNLLLLDNSHEAKAKRKTLQEQLQQIDEEISEKRHDREIELRKESLNDQLEAKETEISQKEELETEYHEKELNLLDEKKQYWEQYYTDQLNNERKLKEIKEKIRNEEFESLKQEFGDYKNWLVESMPELQKTLSESMEKVGSSIRQNIIDELDNAINKIQEFKSLTEANGDFGSSNNYNNPENKSTLIEGDMQVLLGKFMTDVLAKNETNSIRQANIREKAHNLANEGRIKNNSQIPINIDFNDYKTSTLSDADRLKLSQYFKEQAKKVVISPDLQSLIEREADLLKLKGRSYVLQNSASALQGGITNYSSNGIDGLGGKAMIVHPNELINSPIDTNNLLSMANILERAGLFFRPLFDRLPSFTNTFSTVQAASASTYGDINIEFNIDKMNGDMNDLTKFSKMINTDLLRKRGMRN